ncbi:MAG: hypothetical protein KAX49_14145 [Halanaerobiales bacterium]|nr:hypothetical protein [Halanaerobiales bacterium]
MKTFFNILKFKTGNFVVKREKKRNWALYLLFIIILLFTISLGIYFKESHLRTTHENEAMIVDIQPLGIHPLCPTFYEINLNLALSEHKFSAEVSLKYDEEIRAGTTIPFTLYHGMKIISVTNGKGLEIAYTRKGNWIYFQLEKPLHEIKVIYSGIVGQEWKSDSFQELGLRQIVDKDLVFLSAVGGWFPLPGEIDLFIKYNDYLDSNFHNLPERFFSINIEDQGELKYVVPNYFKTNETGTFYRVKLPLNEITIIGAEKNEKIQDILKKIIKGQPHSG